MLAIPGTWVAKPMLYSPKTESRANSLAMVLSAGEVLAILTMLRSADKESDRTLASTLVPGSHIRTATSSANASQVVLCAESPTLAWKRLNMI